MTLSESGNKKNKRILSTPLNNHTSVDIWFPELNRFLLDAFGDSCDSFMSCKELRVMDFSNPALQN